MLFGHTLLLLFSLVVYIFQNVNFYICFYGVVISVLAFKCGRSWVWFHVGSSQRMLIFICCFTLLAALMCRSKDRRAHIYMYSVFLLTLTFSCELLPSLGIHPSILCKLFTCQSSPLKLIRHIGTIGMMLRRSPTKNLHLALIRQKPCIMMHGCHK